MLNLNDLDTETKDRLEMKEQQEPTFVNAIDRDYTSIMFNTLTERSDPKKEQSFLASVFGVQGTGKSYSALSCCGFIDKSFDANRQVFFNYRDLIKARKTFKSGMAILMDEQQGLYGVDSHRITVLLTALKEQLRKRAIHMFNCSPVLRPEYESSMYVLETMFIDKENDECYLAYKTRELHTLGYVIVPHPSKFLSKDQIKAYEEQKDIHLNVLTDQMEDSDDVQEMANEVINSDVFKKTWVMYQRNGKKFVSSNSLYQIINIVFPEFKGSIITNEVMGRIKFLMEQSGIWKPK